MSTEDRIAARALEMFNKKGIEYVGMRELAAALDTKLGNITYYFPTKEDLVMRLAVDLSKLNSSVLNIDNDITIESYLKMCRMHFECQFQYRCLFLSFVHLMKQYSKLSARYKKVEELRTRTASINVENLVNNGYLKRIDDNEKKLLLSFILFLSRFWISEAVVSYSKLKPTEQIEHYLRLLANILYDYCTAKGKKQIDLFLRKK